MSLAEPGSLDPAEYPEEDREFNRYTLLGEHDALFVALLKERHRAEGGNLALEDLFRAHMNRGIMLLQRRMRDIDQIGDLVAKNR
jgi:DNA sulfur modification protein DndE